MKNFEGNDFDKIHEALSKLKKRKLKIKKILIEKYKNMSENLNFEQNYYPETAESIYKNGQHSIKILKWLALYDHHYEKIN